MHDLLKGLTVVEGADLGAGPSCGLHRLQMGAEGLRLPQIGVVPDDRRWAVSATDGATPVFAAASRLGEHPEEVLMGLLSPSSGEIGRLHHQGLAAGATGS